MRLFPRREVTAFVGLMEVDQLVIGPLRPAPRGLKTLAGEDGHGRRDGDVGREIKVDLVLPIEPAGGNPRVGQPVERDVVEHVVACEIACGVSIDRTPEHRRGHRRRRLGIAVTMVEQPGRQIDGRIRQPVQCLRARAHDLRVGASLRKLQLELLEGVFFVVR